MFKWVRMRIENEMELGNGCTGNDYNLKLYSLSPC